MPNVTLDGDDEQFVWSRIVASLRPVHQGMIDEFVRRLNRVPGYSQGSISDAEVREVASESLSRIVGVIEEPASAIALKDHAERLGQKRAEQEVPVDALLEAIGLNFPVLSRALLAASDSHTLPIVARRLESVWAVVNEYSTAAYRGYMNSRISIVRHREDLRRQILAELYVRGADAPSMREKFERNFMAPADSPCVLLVTVAAEAAAFTDFLQDERCHLLDQPPYVYALWSCRSDAEVRSLASSVESMECAGGLEISWTGIFGLAIAARRAEALAEVAATSDCRPLTMGKDWARVARAGVKQAGFFPREDIDRQLGRVKSNEAERLRRTVTAFLETGSVNETAQRIFAHRNTVLNHLTRFEQITGIAVNVPAQSALLALAWLSPGAGEVRENTCRPESSPAIVMIPQ